MELTTETNSSFFPSPPKRYLNFTQSNLKLSNYIITKIDSKDLFNSNLQKKLIEESLKEEEKGKGKKKEEEEEEEGEEKIDLKEIEEIDLRTLSLPPNLNYIKERGGWTCFGDWEPWPGNSSRAMLEGMPKLYEEKMERKESLQALLNTLIYSYLKLLNQLEHQGPSSLLNLNQSINLPSSTDQIISHIELTSFNMHGLCNELRPRQAIESLKLMMKEQAKEKREKARLVLKNCEDLRNELIGFKHDLHFNDDHHHQFKFNEKLKLIKKEEENEFEEDFLNEKEKDWNKLLSFVDNL
ncbi:MED7 protein-domain-containing protein [Melampsora americana]|nr:MED7 protein-domain-containing protein [Melampsora americana]